MNKKIILKTIKNRGLEYTIISLFIRALSLKLEDYDEIKKMNQSLWTHFNDCSIK